MELAKSIETGQVKRSAAEVYEDFFVPALFQRWTAPVAEAADVQPGQKVLDVACGTGVLTREIAARVGTEGKAIGLDINEGMLAVARAQASSIEWRQGEAEALPFDEASFDAVVSQFGLMFFRDREKAIREMTRVLRPRGRLAVAVWDRIENTPGYAAAASLLQRLFGATVAESLRSPYVLGDTRLLKNLFGDAGLSAVGVETHDGVVEFPSIEAWMHTDIKGWTLADVLSEEQYALLLREAQFTLNPFVAANGRVAFRAPAHVVTAIKP